MTTYLPHKNMLHFFNLPIDTFPEKLTTKNMEQQKRIQYFTSNPFTPEIAIAARDDGWPSSAETEETEKRKGWEGDEVTLQQKVINK